MSVGSAFYPRAAPLNRKQQWREWSGYFAASAYPDSHEIEYNAIREAAALIDVSPLYKYLVSGRLHAARRPRDHPGRKQARRRPRLLHVLVQRGRPRRRRRHGRPPGRAQLPLDRRRPVAALAPDERSRPGRRDRGRERTGGCAGGAGAAEPRRARSGHRDGLGDLKYFGRRAAQVGSIPVDVSRTGYTGDLGYEVWVESAHAVDLWDALVRAGSAYGIRPAGMLALDIARIEAGLILIEVDFDSVRRALIPEQSYSPFELGVLGRFVDFEKPVEFVGRRALEREQGRGGPARRLVGLELDWEPLEELYRAKGLTPTLEPAASRVPVPCTRGAARSAKQPARRGARH